MTPGSDQGIADIVEQEQSRLRRFIQRRVRDSRDVEDILQEVFYELVNANRRLMPIAHVSAWLFQVAHNRITDLLRRRTPAPLVQDDDHNDDDRKSLEDWLPSPDAGPEAIYRRRRLLDELTRALAELPRAQRDVFVAHELEGRPFAAIAADTGTNLNTLLSRKRYAVRHLRARLQQTFDDLIQGT